MEIKLEGMDISFPLPDFFSRKADHVVVDDKWYPIQKGALPDLRKQLAELNITDSGTISIKQYLGLKGISDYKVYDLPPESISAERMAKIINAETITSVFTGSLYPYQRDGYSWLSFVNKQDVGCILADEMGLGKTIQVIALIANNSVLGRISLVVAPATLLENWRREFEKFAPGVSTLVHQGGRRTGDHKVLRNYDAVITSYETVVRDRYMFKMLDWDTVILDEAQAIKNPAAKRTRAVKAMPRRGAVAMTGTPVQNNLIDLWSICDFAIPGYLGSLRNFKQEYPMDVDSARRVEPLVSPIMLRRRVSDVAKDLPPKIEIPQVLELDHASIDNYESIRIQTNEEYETNAILVVLGKLRMFCAHPTLLTEAFEEPAMKSVKYNRLLEILEEIFSNHSKALVFTSWTKMIDIIAADIKRRFNVYTDIIDGRVSTPERQNIVDTFNNIGEPGILVLNPGAGGVGLNITGANHVIHYNLEWNPATIDQATARAYRTGQNKPVTVHYLYYKETVEEVIMERLKFKRDVSDAAVIGITGADKDYKDMLEALRRSPLKG